MHFVEKEPSKKRIDFDQKLKSNKILRVPGAYNPLTAKLIEEIGYDAVYAVSYTHLRAHETVVKPISGKPRSLAITPPDT